MGGFFIEIKKMGVIETRQKNDRKANAIAEIEGSSSE